MNKTKQPTKKNRMSEQKQCGQLVAEIQTNAYLIGFFFYIYIFRSLNSFMIFFVQPKFGCCVKINKCSLMVEIPVTGGSREKKPCISNVRLDTMEFIS